MNEERSPVLRALHQGIQIEIQGFTFYRRAAEVVADPYGKQTFTSLKRDELEHLRLLKVQYGSLAGEGHWVALADARSLQPADDVETLFPQQDDALASLLKPDSTDLECLQLALDFERRGYQMYQQAAEETGDPAGRALYEFLARQEQLHYDYIDRARQYLETEGAWYYDEDTFPIFEGG